MRAGARSDVVERLAGFGFVGDCLAAVFFAGVAALLRHFLGGMGDFFDGMRIGPLGLRP